MGELEEKLGAILSNQDAMSQIMALAKSLGGGAAPGAGAAPDGETSADAGVAPDMGAAPGMGAGPGAASPAPPPAGGPGLDLGSLDPRLLSMAARLAGAYSSGGDDSRVALLTALSPFVKEERRAKLGKAIQIARLTRVARIALDSFRTREENHV